MKEIKIFISSVQAEFSRERKLLCDYIRQDALLSRFFLPFLFEELPAQDQSASRAYLEEVAKDKIYLLLMGEQYGYEDAEGISPTEREFDAATAHHAYRIVMLKRTANRHPKEQLFVEKVERQVVRDSFASDEELKSGVYASLVEYMVSHGILNQWPFDAAVNPIAKMDDLDSHKIAWFVGVAREKRQFPITFSQENIPQILRSLHLLTDDNLLKNAALLLFAKDTQKWFATATAKCVQFYGTKKQKPILTQHIYTGTVFDVVDEAVGFVMSHINQRVGERNHSAQAEVTPEIPAPAVAEAIVNAVVHRDYTSNGSVQVELYADRLEIWNPGRLPQGLTIAKLSTTHESLPPNPILANPVYLAGYIEQIGTGTTDIIDLCREAGLRVKFVEDGNFTTIIYRKHHRKAGQATGQVAGQATGQVKDQVKRLVLAIDNQTLSRQDIMKRLSLRGRDNFREKYMVPASDMQLVNMLYPDDPNRPDQQYYLSDKGIQLLETLKQTPSERR